MDLLIKTAQSNISDPQSAGRDVAEKALAKLAGKPPTFALIFSSAGYDQKKLFEGIGEVLNNVPMSGCTGEGIITSQGSDEGSAIVSLMLFSGKDLSIHNFLATGLEKHSYQSAQEIVKKINKIKRKSNSTIFLLADSMTVNTTEVFRAFEEDLSEPTLILGGTAGDMMQFNETYQFHDGKVYQDALSVVFMTGDYGFDFFVSHGCEEIGLIQTVTKSNANSIVEIDGKPAWDSFRDYLPGNPSDFKAEDAFHLCLGELHHLESPCGEQLIIRMPVGLVKNTGAVKFSVEIPEGTEIRFTRRDPQIIAEKVICGFKALIERNEGKKPIAVFQYDCAGRGRAIYDRCLNEAIFEPLKKLLGPETPWIGFHTYGEIAPLCGKVFFHNFTAVIGIMFEEVSR
ncbi:MAG: FIST N-terminal domain-containing protein [Pseudomonadota bacterium]|nr:FIST C-terminal domain-containing protein [Gammaproteobacteria bacterium]MBU1628634.1 FIST C-terminal domain-containing protein [Gammaproteobacteria bacterium]MBU1927177.1 FIST C-terminal domain-containing protein [Gammaproteobacteria bacterium]MBU2545533.1 FIST C-terminal domain-containing protein [Gammaproteobacteria bacterium]